MVKAVKAIHAETALAKIAYYRGASWMILLLHTEPSRQRESVGGPSDLPGPLDFRLKLIARDRLWRSRNTAN